ncbi:MAG: TetR/AcrR family transcriptional regulator [Reyranellaceae bacterium]
MARKKIKISDIRRAQIISAAKFEFARNGFHATTIPDIAQRANISAGLVYHYFKDKENLLFQILCEVFDKYLTDIPRKSKGRDSLARFRAAVMAFCKVVDANSDATMLVYREIPSLTKAHRNALEAKELQSIEMIEKFIRDCIDDGVFREINTQMFANQVVMFCHSWALKAWRFRTQMSVGEYVERGLRLLLHPVLEGGASEA